MFFTPFHLEKDDCTRFCLVLVVFANSELCMLVRDSECTKEGKCYKDKVHPLSSSSAASVGTVPTAHRTLLGSW